MKEVQTSKTIILDYGHGGVKDGVYTTAPAKQAMVNGKMIHEGVINRDIGYYLHKLLALDGYDVIETVAHDDPIDLSLRERVRIANSIDDAIFISIHCNAFNGKAHGFEVWTDKKKNESDILAECVADSIEEMEHTGLVMRFDESDGYKDKEAEFYVLRKVKIPCVLVECFFFDNAEDIQRYEDQEWLKDFVERFRDGIVNYLNK